MQEILIALADSTRRKIFDKLVQEYPLYRFSDKDKYKGNTVKWISRDLKLSPSTVSYHLKILSEAHLVNYADTGKWRHFLPNFYKFEDAANWFSQMESIKDLSFKRIGTIKVRQIEKASFKELLSLITNHGYLLLHETSRENTLVGYLKLKRYSIYYELLYIRETNVINVRQISPKKDYPLDTYLLTLAKRYSNTF